MKKRRIRINPFIMGMVGFLFLLLGFVVFSTRVFAGIGLIIYEISPRYTHGVVVVRFDNAVYGFEVMPSVAGLFLTTFAFGRETLKNVTIAFRHKPMITIRNASDLRFSVSMLFSSWFLFYLWLKSFLF